MRDLSSLNIGDKITVISAGFGPQVREFRTITHKTKTTITDDKGSKWAISGRRWGNSDSWRGAHCSAFEEEDIKHQKDEMEEFQLVRQRNYISTRSFREYPPELIREVYRILKQYDDTKISNENT